MTRSSSADQTALVSQEPRPLNVEDQPARPTRLPERRAEHRRLSRIERILVAKHLVNERGQVFHRRARDNRLRHQYPHAFSQHDADHDSASRPRSHRERGWNDAPYCGESVPVLPVVQLAQSLVEHHTDGRRQIQAPHLSRRHRDADERRGVLFAAPPAAIPSIRRRIAGNRRRRIRPAYTAAPRASRRTRGVASGEDLTPQPPSLRGKGEKAPLSPGGGGWGRGPRLGTPPRTPRSDVPHNIHRVPVVESRTLAASGRRGGSRAGR